MSWGSCSNRLKFWLEMRLGMSYLEIDAEKSKNGRLVIELVVKWTF